MFKENIKSARKAKKLNQDEMAELCGLSLSAYKNYESGKSEPTMTNLIKIANVLETSIDELCEVGKSNDMEMGLKMRLRKILDLEDEEKRAIDLVIQSILLRHHAEATSKMFTK